MPHLEDLNSDIKENSPDLHKLDINKSTHDNIEKASNASSSIISRQDKKLDLNKSFDKNKKNAGIEIKKHNPINTTSATFASIATKGVATGETINLDDFKNLPAVDLLQKTKELDIKDIDRSLSKQELILALAKYYHEKNYMLISSGILDIVNKNENYGFLRSADTNYLTSEDNIYISSNKIKKYSLIVGDNVLCEVRFPKKNEHYLAVLRILKINNISINELRKNVQFENLIPLFPDKRLTIETNQHFHINDNLDLTPRIIDIVAPIGLGQRSLIVAPPKAGKTIITKSIANSITNNYPDIDLIILLIDERPEEVTDMKYSVKNAEIVASTFDEPASNHVQLAEIVIAKAKRMVEYGRDVVIILDSLTRLARAYNSVSPSSGKVLTGGVDSNALHKPKRFFGAARNIQGENSGSLTIIATALIETGSKMDEVIFEEFKGTGNSEILLDRKLSDKRIFPAIDITRSSTRRDDLLLSKNNLSKVWMLRKILSQMSPIDAMEFLQDKMNKTKNNDEFFYSMKKK